MKTCGIIRAAEPEINLWFHDHVRERLAKMYGSEDKIPPVAKRIQRGMIADPPAFEGKAILRGAMLYFVPGGGIGVIYKSPSQDKPLFS